MDADANHRDWREEVNEMKHLVLKANSNELRPKCVRLVANCRTHWEAQACGVHVPIYRQVQASVCSGQFGDHFTSRR